MKVAALYDVHAMPWALEPVLAELDADAIVFGGDFVGGPFPRETLELVRGLDATFVRGNAERAPDDWNRAQLTTEELARLAELPLTAELDGVLYCHATPTDDAPRTSAASTDERIAELFAGVRGTVVIGHTHHQFDRRAGDVRVVNAGSVGIPWEGDVAAYWVLVEDGEPVHRRTPIDLERALRDVRASGWPRAERFVDENLLHPFSQADAIADIEGGVA